MKESFATQNFIDLLIIFLVNYRHVETIPIVHGINLTSEQFSLAVQNKAYVQNVMVVTCLVGHLLKSVEQSA